MMSQDIGTWMSQDIGTCPNCEIEFIIDIPIAGSIPCPNPECIPGGWMIVRKPRRNDMTADDARQLTAQAMNPNARTVNAIVQMWHFAIKKAAAEGRDYVRESECGRLRTPFILASERAAAIEQLRRDGFTARHESVGRNETEMTVSWGPPVIVPPRGGSGTAPADLRV